MDLNINDFVVLKDKQSLRQQMQENKRPIGIITKVVNISTVDSAHTCWKFYELECEMFLVVQTCGAHTELTLYFIPGDFNNGNRADVLNDNNHWLFNEPLSEWDYGDLEYADTIINEAEGATYKRKLPTIYADNGELQSVTEWVTDAEVDNPELIALEIGDSDEGGFIRFLQGCQIKSNDIEKVQV